MINFTELSNTCITRLPEELKDLTNLKYLNLEDMLLLRIPRQVISKLSMLQVLRMFRYNKDPDTQEEDRILFDEGELFFDELVCLENLNVLSIHLKSYHFLRRFLSSYRLLKNCPVVESLSVTLEGDSSALNVLSLEVLKDLHKLIITRAYLVAWVVIDHVPQFDSIPVPQFHSLHTVKLISCHKLSYLTWLIFAPNLQILEIEDCIRIKEIINIGFGVDEMMMMINAIPLPETERKMMMRNILPFVEGVMMRNILPFARLEHLILTDLHELESIYCDPLAFPYLKRIWIKGCPNLKKLPLDSNRTTTALEIKGEQHWWNELQWEDRDHFLPFFKPLLF